MDEQWRLARKSEALRIRSAVIQAVRLFFIDRDFLEVETPLRIPEIAPEAHIEAPASENWYLQTSPELCMKRLLAAGYPRLFQVARCFRKDERGQLHLPEFTMLEWYEKGVCYLDLMERCEDLIGFTAEKLDRGNVLVTAEDRHISLKKPWERLTVAEAFRRYTSLTPEEAVARDRFDEIIGFEIEPNLGRGRPTFLYDYPVSLGSLARSKRDDPSVAERFELYLDGIELANAFSELNDEVEQRRRFENEQQRRAADGGTVYREPERFLAALPHLPDSAGIALGLDRLVMLFAGAACIDDVVAFTPEML